MLEWSDTGYITGTHKHGESGFIVSILTQNHGRHKGYMRLSKKQAATLQLGNFLQATWKSRVIDQLGSWALEPLKIHASDLFGNAKSLTALTVSCRWMDLVLPERQECPEIYEAFTALIQDLKTDHWVQAFVHFEIELLKYLGFGLDFSHCAATGVTDDLIYVSPRTGRSVSKEAGDMYKEKLLTLPQFLTSKEQPTSVSLNEGLDLTKYFFERQVLVHHNKKLPEGRERLYQAA